LHGGYYYLYLWSRAAPAKLYVRRGDVAAVREVIEARRRRRRVWRSEIRQARSFLRRMMRSAVGVWI
jgi:hypothetical protein